MNNQETTIDRTRPGANPPAWAPAGPRRVPRLLMPLASLQLTVVLLAMAIFIVLAGTVAQIDKDILAVVKQYFRTPVAWIDVGVFFPRDWHVPGRFPFPGGFLIGTFMVVNLLVVHCTRVRLQAHGWRRYSGMALIAAGVGLTWLVVAGQGDPTEADGATAIPWATLWVGIKGALAVAWLAVVFKTVKVARVHGFERVLLAVAVVGLGALLACLLIRSDTMVLGAPSLRILWQLIQGGAASLVLLAGCALLFPHRAGLILVHAGVALIMANEIVVHRLHNESQMNIREGQTVNFAQDIRELELAVVDPDFTAQEQQAVVVPESILRGGRQIDSEQMPFTVTVVEFLPRTSRPRRLRPGEKGRATAGIGLQWTAEKPSANPGDGVDMAAAFIKFLDRKNGKDLGTYFFSLFLAEQGFTENIAAGGKTYDVSLRFKRTYKPYSVQLLDARADKYIGTDTPRNYSSDIRLIDPSRHVDREVRIWMNNPLRYEGETFYQSQFSVDSQTGVESTGLQVVANTGWMIPYVACMIVATGMVAHFYTLLLRFLRDRARRNTASVGMVPAGRGKDPVPAGAGAAAPSRAARLFPWAVGALAGLSLVASLVGSQLPDRGVDTMHVDRFGTLPVVYQGRVKPFDTLARNSLRVISGKETFLAPDGKRQPAIRWLLDVMLDSNAPGQQRVFKISNLELLETLGLKRRPRYRYAFDEFRGRLEELDRQSQLARRIAADNRSIYQKHVLELDRKLHLVYLLGAAHRFPELRADHIKDDLQAAARRREELSGIPLPLAIPPTPGERGATWEPFTHAVVTAWAKSMMGQQPNPAVSAMTAIFLAYQKGDARAFNEQLSRYEENLAANRPTDFQPAKTDFEAFFNRFEPFFLARLLYATAFLLTALAWLGWSEPLNRSAFWLIVLALLVHTFALLARIYISGRPPVTNLYSSAVFLGWGCVVLGLILELMYRLGIGNVIATIAGFVTLLIAHLLAGDGDTFVVLQAVLDTQFWLATHVTCITLGYSTTFIAGILGVIYVLRGVLTRSLTPRVSQELGRMIYGMLCFAILLSFVGTVLGGLWADDSWGRFWGWDPKENGALIIVLWNALVLHARWSGMVHERGLAVLSVGGNIATSWSWFGVNELGTGLHSYGFTEGVALSLLVFVGSQLAVIGLGAMPRRMWRSMQPETAAGRPG